MCGCHCLQGSFPTLESVGISVDCHEPKMSLNCILIFSIWAGECSAWKNECWHDSGHSNFFGSIDVDGCKGASGVFLQGGRYVQVIFFQALEVACAFGYM